jgi:hypothetical protein
MSELPEFRVYLSSTIDDLVDEREAAKEIIRRHALVKDSYRASEEGTVTTCTQDVREAHLYVGIIGQRYGWVGKGQDKSITELEYEACQEPGRPRIPRLIFLRTTNPDKFTDAHTRPETAEHIKKFRERASREQQPYHFNTVAEFRVALSEAVMKQRDSFHREKAPGQAIFDARRVWESALHPIVLFNIPGADDTLSELIVRNRPALFTNAELSLTKTDIAWQVDQGLRKGQVCCVVLTSQTIKRILDNHQSGRFISALGVLRERLGLACALCIDVDPEQIPKEWQPVSAVFSTSLEKNTDKAIDKIISEVKAYTTLTVQPLLALSCVVIAPTRAELDALVNADGSGFSGYDDEELKVQRRKQFGLLTEATQRIYPKWPADMYGDRREDWRCFGPQSNSVAELIRDVVMKINTSTRGSRERELLQDAEIVVRYYTLDEYLHDTDGSRRIIEALRERGCLLVIDETALLHPDLRKAANVLLASPRSAIVSVSPCDPAHMPTRLMLSESSFLRVGGIVDRFRTEHDPQCELALNSEERVRRWLRMAIPRLLVESDNMLSRPRLSNRADQLFV